MKRKEDTSSFGIFFISFVFLNIVKELKSV